MTTSNRLAKQKGVALVMGLILLLVSSFLALAAFQSGIFQERMASNQYNKAMAFMAAEQGGTAFLGAVRSGTLNVDQWNTSVFADWQTDTGGVSYYRVAAVTPVGTAGNMWDVMLDGVSRRSQTEPENLALSQLRIRIQRNIAGGGSAAAINLVGALGTFEVPNSNSFKVQGAANGPAVATVDTDDAVAIQTGLVDKGRLQNYTGGIGTRNFDDTLFRRDDGAGTLLDLKSFVDTLCLVPDARCGTTVPADTVTKGDPNTPRTPQITVVRDNATLNFTGNDKGAGLLVVEGNLVTNGTPSWDGIILVLGGSFNIVGGGNGGVNGTVYVLDINRSDYTLKSPESVSFLSTSPEGNGSGGGQGGGNSGQGGQGATQGGGGGNALYTHNCAQVKESLELVTNDPVQLGTWMADFGCGGITGTGTGPITFTVLGWVETLN
jgi:hypothetical protein